MSSVQAAATIIQAVATLIQALAWPTAVVIVVIVFRIQIGALLTRPLRSFKAGLQGVEAEWEHEVEQIEAQVGIAATPQERRWITDPELAALLPVAKALPSGAVLEAFKRVERELRRVVASRETGIAASSSSIGLARSAASRGLISRDAVEAYESMRALRNLAVHGEDILTESQALQYLAIADRVLELLNKPTAT